MKQHLYRKNGSESVPDSLEGKVTHDDILDKFRECYSELYNSYIYSPGIRARKVNPSSFSGNKAPMVLELG